MDIRLTPLSRIALIFNGSVAAILGDVSIEIGLATTDLAINGFKLCISKIRLSTSIKDGVPPPISIP